MTARRDLLMFLGEPGGWLRLDGESVVARGPTLEAIPPLIAEDAEAEENVWLILPGCDVAVHWVDLPGDLAPAQANAAARLLAAEVSAEPLESVHVVLGPIIENEDERCMALVSNRHMDAALAEAQAIGFDPDYVIPEPLLVAPPEAGVRLFKRGVLDNVRGARRAFAAEAELSALLLSDETIETIDADRFEQAMPAMVAAPPLNLRQGAYAKRRRWVIDWALIRRLALIAGAILVITLLIQLTLIARYSFAADAVERETAEIARGALPGASEITDPQTQLRERLATLGGGPGYSAVASAIFSAVRQSEGAELQSLVYSSDGGARLIIAAPTQAGLDTLYQQMTAAGLAVTPGAVRDGGGRRIGEFSVRAP